MDEYTGLCCDNTWFQIMFMTPHEQRSLNGDGKGFFYTECFHRFHGNGTGFVEQAGYSGLCYCGDGDSYNGVSLRWK